MRLVKRLKDDVINMCRPGDPAYKPSTNQKSKRSKKQRSGLSTPDTPDFTDSNDHDFVQNDNSTDSIRFQVTSTQTTKHLNDVMVKDQRAKSMECKFKEVLHRITLIDSKLEEIQEQMEDTLSLLKEEMATPKEKQRLKALIDDVVTIMGRGDGQHAQRETSVFTRLNDEHTEDEDDGSDGMTLRYKWVLDRVEELRDAVTTIPTHRDHEQSPKGEIHMDTQLIGKEMNEVKEEQDDDARSKLIEKEDGWRTLLTKWGLAKFADAMEEKGYDDPNYWHKIEETELIDDVGMKKGHLMKWKMLLEELMK